MNGDVGQYRRASAIARRLASDLSFSVAWRSDLRERGESGRLRSHHRGELIERAPWSLLVYACRGRDLCQPLPTRLNLRARIEDLEEPLRASFAADQRSVGLSEASSGKHNLCC